MPGIILNILPVLTHLILTTVYGVVVFLLVAFSSEEANRADRLGNCCGMQLVSRDSNLVTGL